MISCCAIDGIEARAWLQTSSVYQIERSRCADTTLLLYSTHNLIIHAPLYNGERGAVDAKEAGGGGVVPSSSPSPTDLSKMPQNR